MLPALLLLAILVHLSIARQLFNDGDTSWHLAAGRWIIEAGAIPRSDPFSFTHDGWPWTAHEWLAELVMAGLFRIGSWDALSLLFATAVASLLGMIGWQARKRSASLLFIIAVILAVLVVLAPYIVARPHVLAWPILCGWTILLLRAREQERAPPLAAASIMLVWANLHGSFLFGLLLIGPFALEALLGSSSRLATLRQWGRFGLLSLIAAVVTPHGVEGLFFPIQVSGMQSLPLIAEWRPTILSEAMGFQAVLIGSLAIALYKGVRIPLIRVILLALLMYMAFQHVRHQAVLAIVGSLILVQPFAEAIRRDEEPVSHTNPPGAKFWAMLALGVGIIWIIRLQVTIPVPDSQSNPWSAIERVPARLHNVPVLNSYSFGGPLILSNIRPFIDGRADLYGDEHMFEHQRIVDGDWNAFTRAARKWGIGWTMLAPDSPLIARLDRDRAWRRIHSDPWAVIHVARSAQPEGAVRIGVAAD